MREVLLKEFGQRVQVRRKCLGLTQEALAELCDVTPQFISYAEAGLRAPRPENLLKLAAGLKVSVDYLLTGQATEEDVSILAQKLRRLTPNQLRAVEAIVDECSASLNPFETALRPNGKEL